MIVVGFGSPQFKFFCFKLNQNISVKVYHINTCTNTLVDIWSCVAKHIRHFLRENPTPTLNPPIAWAARVSASTNRTPPLITHFSPCIDMATPWTCAYKHVRSNSYFYILYEYTPLTVDSHHL